MAKSTAYLGGETMAKMVFVPIILQEIIHVNPW